MSNTENAKKKEDKKSTLEIKKNEKSEVEISGEIPVDEFEIFRPEAIKSFGDKANIAGFRKGHVPEKVLLDKFGELSILEEMAQKALAKKYPEILIDNNIDAIGIPEIQITKLAKGSPLGFKIKTAIMPEFELPDYKKLAKEKAGKKEEVKVEEKEVDEVIKHIRTQRQRSQQAAKDVDAKEEDKKDLGKKDKEELPPLTDEMAKELGFEGVEDFKKIIRENLKQEKEARAKDKHRSEIIDALLENTKFNLPDIIVDNELERMMAQLKGEIANMGLEWKQYLEHVKKTEEDLRKASRQDAEKRAKAQLIINKIAVAEKVEPKEDAVEKEVKALSEKYKDADPLRTRAYVETVFTNEAVLNFLEEQ